MKKLLLLLVCMTLLSACVSAPMVQAPAELAATHGYVYVNFPKTGSGDSLTLQSVQDKTDYTLIARVGDGNRAYGRWLPAGEYKLAKWLGNEWGEYPTVVVKPGQITDLGSLIPISVGGYDYVVLPVRHPETADQVKLAINEYRQYLKSDETINWIPQVPPKRMTTPQQMSGLGLIADLMLAYDRERNTPSMNNQLRASTSISDFFRLAKLATPPLTHEHAIDAEGNLYYGADMGQVRVRSRDGKWSALDTGTLREVTSIESYGKSLVAGSTDGVIRLSADGGKSWKAVATVDKGEWVVDIDRVGTRWMVVTSRFSGYQYGLKAFDQIKVYAATKDDFGDLTSVGQFPLKSPVIVTPRGQAFDNFYYVNIFPDFVRLDLSTMQWKTISPPVSVTGFSVSPTAGFIAAYRNQGAFSKLYVSADRGETWTQYDQPPYTILDINFDSADSGQASRMSHGAFSVTVEIMEYDRANNRWIKTHEAPDGCVRMMPDARNAPAYCITRGGSILSYTGKEWKAEFASD